MEDVREDYAAGLAEIKFNDRSKASEVDPSVKSKRKSRKGTSNKKKTMQGAKLDFDQVDLLGLENVSKENVEPDTLFQLKKSQPGTLDSFFATKNSKNQQEDLASQNDTFEMIIDQEDNFVLKESETTLESVMAIEEAGEETINPVVAVLDDKIQIPHEPMEEETSSIVQEEKSYIEQEQTVYVAQEDAFGQSHQDLQTISEMGIEQVDEQNNATFGEAEGQENVLLEKESQRSEVFEVQVEKMEEEILYQETSGTTDVADAVSSSGKLLTSELDDIEIIQIEPADNVLTENKTEMEPHIEALSHESTDLKILTVQQNIEESLVDQTERATAEKIPHNLEQEDELISVANQERDEVTDTANVFVPEEFHPDAEEVGQQDTYELQESPQIIREEETLLYQENLEENSEEKLVRETLHEELPVSVRDVEQIDDNVMVMEFDGATIEVTSDTQQIDQQEQNVQEIKESSMDVEIHIEQEAYEETSIGDVDQKSMVVSILDKTQFEELNTLGSVEQVMDYQIQTTDISHEPISESTSLELEVPVAAIKPDSDANLEADGLIEAEKEEQLIDQELLNHTEQQFDEGEIHHTHTENQDISGPHEEHCEEKIDAESSGNLIENQVNNISDATEVIVELQIGVEAQAAIAQSQEITEPDFLPNECVQNEIQENEPTLEKIELENNIIVEENQENAQEHQSEELIEISTQKILENSHFELVTTEVENAEQAPQIVENVEQEHLEFESEPHNIVPDMIACEAMAEEVQQESLQASTRLPDTNDSRQISSLRKTDSISNPKQMATKKPITPFVPRVALLSNQKFGSNMLAKRAPEKSDHEAMKIKKLSVSKLSIPKVAGVSSNLNTLQSKIPLNPTLKSNPLSSGTEKPVTLRPGIGSNLLPASKPLHKSNMPSSQVKPLAIVGKPLANPNPANSALNRKPSVPVFNKNLAQKSLQPQRTIQTGEKENADKQKKPAVPSFSSLGLKKKPIVSGITTTSGAKNPGF